MPAFIELVGVLIAIGLFALAFSQVVRAFARSTVDAAAASARKPFAIALAFILALGVAAVITLSSSHC